MNPFIFTLPRYSVEVLSCLFCFLLALKPETGVAQFQNIYGSGTNDVFTRVIPHGPDFYVLGWTDNGKAAVSRINGAGVLQWTRAMNLLSSWTDGVVVPGSGNLIMVGFDNTKDHSIIGELTPTGSVVCIKLLDEPGLEGLFRIEANPGGSTYSVMGFHNTIATLRDVVVYNISPGCVINSKKQFFSSVNDDFFHDMEVMSANGDIVVAGPLGSNAVIYRVSSSGNFVNGVQGPVQFNYTDLAETANGDLLAVATRNIGTAFLPPRAMRFDNNLLPLWEISLNGLLSLDQVVDGGNGVIYLTGAAQISGSIRPVVVKIDDSNGPPVAPVWVKYLGNLGNYNVGNLVITPSGLASADGILAHPNGFGQLDAFLALTGPDLNSNCTFEAEVTLTPENTLFDGPAGIDLFMSEMPQEMGVDTAWLDWEQVSVCSSTPCEASFTINFVDNCGHVQVTSTSTGQLPLSYQWCSGESTPTLDVILPCGPHTFCVSVTCGDGSVSTATQTITIVDNIPPVINCPQDMTFTAFYPNCDMPVFNIHSLGATDNCGVPTIDYAISGATTASGTGDASGTVFNSGTSTVTYTATDWCMNTASCSFDVTVVCDTCTCLGFQNMEFINFPGAPNISVACDSSPVLLPCIPSDGLYWFQWQLQCSDPMCMQSMDYMIAAASGGPALLSGTVTGIPSLSFSYGQLSGPGNYQLILTGHCGTDSCTCIVNFSLPECCTCGGFSDMAYRPAQGAMNMPVACGDTLGVICDQSFHPQIAGLFQCQGTQCPASTTLNWVLNDPSGNPIQNGPANADPDFDFALTPTWFNDPGLYTLVITGDCGGQTCEPCVFYIESAGCLCCEDFEAFCALINEGFSVEQDSCTVTVCSPQFDSCHYFGMAPDFGDGTIVPPVVVAANGCWTHTYTQSGVYTICAQVYEDTCWNKEMCVTVDVACPAPCHCGAFTDMFVRGPQGALSQPVMCGGPPLNIGCPAPGIGFTLTGSFQCEGADCPPEADADWELQGPDGGAVATGFVQVNPWFAIQLTSGNLTQSGVYTLILTGHCGSETCPCVIQFLVEEGCADPCPCGADDLPFDIIKGVATSFSSTSCKACFTPLGLKDCDDVIWNVIIAPPGTPAGTSVGKQSFCYTFPGFGNYPVYMKINRKRADGSICDSQTYSFAVTTTCQFRPDCDMSILENPRFSEGAAPGGLNTGGAATGWYAPFGDPVVLSGAPGSLDGWTILLTGNLDDIDVLSNLEPVCLPKDTGFITIRHKIEHWGDPHENLNGKHLKVVLYQGDQFEPNVCDQANCIQLADIDLSPFDTGWTELLLPYDLRTWSEPDTCIWPAPLEQAVSVNLAIYATSAFGSNQGGNLTRTRLQVDNICFGEILVAVDEPWQEHSIRLFPNPTTGLLTLHFEGTAPKAGRLQVLDLWSRTVLTETLPPGGQEHSFYLEALPAGVYIIKVWEDGVAVWLEKVVKQ